MSLINQVHIADIHFGAFNPKRQYDFLVEQFLNKIVSIPKIDMISVNGDLFDHKVMSNSDAAMYASLFVSQLVEITKEKQCTLVLLAGTYSHDYDQLKLFYHYMDNKDVDVRVITSICFINIKNIRVLCIPELYGVDESEYDLVFNHSGWYDIAICHGTFKGAVYGDNVGNGRLLTAEDFKYCNGVAIAGHVHKSACFEGFFYYCGCPYRWKFGEEEEKGFLLCTLDTDTMYHYVEFMPIQCDTYVTIYLDELVSNKSQDIIDYINRVQSERGIDYIKVRIRTDVSGADKTIINNYYRNSNKTFVEFTDTERIEREKLEHEILETENKYSYLMDNSTSELEKFVKFVNNSEGSCIITVEKLREILVE